MDIGRNAETGQVVYLTTELRGAGRIHEIGTRALVVSAAGPELAVEVGGEVVACSALDVAPARSARRRGSRERLRPATA